MKTLRMVDPATSKDGWSEQPRADRVRVRVAVRSVFEVGATRLAIGHFDRPLADEECRRLTRAWKRSGLPEVADFEITAKQVSFLAPAPSVEPTWRSIDALLEAVPLAKAS